MNDLPVLAIGSKNYSSWSLRPWLFLRKVDFAFQERIVHFDAADYRDQIARLSPSGRVPALQIDGAVICDSLAICAYGAEIAGQGLPAGRVARAMARSVSAQMHAGFAALREQCPMNVRALGRRVPQTPELLADIARIDAIWSECRARYGSGGGWLFGEFSIADAMFAPVAFRFRSYGATLSQTSAEYVAMLLADPLMREWREAAETEGHPLASSDRVGAQAV
jgi:glutathione S-transferase